MDRLPSNKRWKCDGARKSSKIIEISQIWVTPKKNLEGVPIDWLILSWKQTNLKPNTVFLSCTSKTSFFFAKTCKYIIFKDLLDSSIAPHIMPHWCELWVGSRAGGLRGGCRDPVLLRRPTETLFIWCFLEHFAAQIQFCWNKIQFCWVQLTLHVCPEGQRELQHWLDSY